MEQGVYVGQRLSFGAAGKTRLQTVAKVANRTREIRPSGMTTGARGNVIYGGTRNPIRNRKSEIGHSSPTGARASFLSKQSPCPDLARASAGKPAGATLQQGFRVTSQVGGWQRARIHQRFGPIRARQGRAARARLRRSVARTSCRRAGS